MKPDSAAPLVLGVALLPFDTGTDRLSVVGGTTVRPGGCSTDRTVALDGSNDVRALGVELMAGAKVVDVGVDGVFMIFGFMMFKIVLNFVLSYNCLSITENSHCTINKTDTTCVKFPLQLERFQC